MAALVHHWRRIRGRISFCITLLGAKQLLFISPDNGAHTLWELVRVKWRNLAEWNCRNGLFFFSLLQRILKVASFSLPFHISLCLFCLSSPHRFSASSPPGWPVWYSTCVVGQQDGLEHGQAPQTTLIYRTAFQSLSQCAFHLHKYKHGGGEGSGNNRQKIKQTNGGRELQSCMKYHFLPVQAGWNRPEPLTAAEYIEHIKCLQIVWNTGQVKETTMGHLHL